MKIFGKLPTVNISNLNFCLVLLIEKNLIWTTLKAIVLNSLHPQISDFQTTLKKIDP